jgi:UMF1 family MFS transporter
MLSIDKNLVIRINLLSAGLWWAIFSIIPLIYFRKITNKKLKENYLNVIKNTTNRSTILIFLTAYTLYSSGIQAIITLSALFVNAELKITMDIIIIGILILQFVAVIGAILFNLIAKNTTNLASLKINLIIWIIAIIFAYLLLQDVTDFFVLCIIIGITIGGTQAISRSIFSQLIPKSKEAQFFSIYELSGKVLSWLGVLFFGLVYQITLSYRLSILSIVLFFALGFVLLCIKGKREKV